MQRRSLLLGSFALPFALALSACGGQTEDQLQSDVQTIAAGVQGIITDLQNVPGLAIPDATLTQITNELALIKSQAAQIAGVLTPRQSVISTFTQTVTTMASLVQPFFPQAAAVAAIVTAAASLAQVLLTESGALKASPSRVWTMPPATARMVLRSAAAK